MTEIQEESRARKEQARLRKGQRAGDLERLFSSVFIFALTSCISAKPMSKSARRSEEPLLPDAASDGCTASAGARRQTIKQKAPQ